KDAVTAIVDGVSEVSVPVIAAILTTIAAFLPLMLMPGLMGKFMRIIPVVVSMALAASLVEALLSLPAHLHEWGEKDPEKLEARERMFDRFTAPYVRLLQRLTTSRLPHPRDARGFVRNALTWLVPTANLFALLVTALLFLALVPGSLFIVFGNVGAIAGLAVPVLGIGGLLLRGLVRGTLFTTFAELFDRARHLRFTVLGAVYLGMVPLALGIGTQVDLDLFGGEEIPQFFVHVRLPEGTALEQTDQVMTEMDRLARETLPAGDLVSVTTHAGFLMTETEWFFKANYGQLDIQLTPPKNRDRTLNDLMALLRPQVERIPGPDSVELVPVSSGPPAGGDVELKLQGPDLARLDELSEVVRAELTRVEGVEDIRDDYQYGKKELRVTVDAERAALYGVSEAQVGMALRAAYDGSEATRFQDDGDDVPVLVRYPREARRDLAWLDRTMVSTATGGLVPFKEVARIETGRSIDAVRRYQGERTITMTANVDKTKNTAINAVTETKQRLADFSERFPGYAINYTGEFQEFQRSLQALSYLSVVGLLLVYMILGTQFGSFLQPIIIIGFTFPGAMFGSAVALLVTGTPLSILTMYGLVALLGIVVNDSLVFISFINGERKRGLAVGDAIVSAGRLRLRPIVLTTVTTVFGLLPMAIGLGGKSDVWAPLATTIAFGLVFATATTLLVIPPVYRVFADLIELMGGGHGNDGDEPATDAARLATPSGPGATDLAPTH
ncbi:MAG: efflux RND transporter permease subunit, partial [Deltaproteobacteria bacterium]|nr:efflux RND transporter permease subunit [Deltaproteobacteria bacterium]